MNHAAIAITKVSSPDDFDVARSLPARYRRWLEEIVGATVQPSSLRELADLECFYKPPSGRLLVAAVDREPAGSLACTGWPPAWAS